MNAQLNKSLGTSTAFRAGFHIIPYRDEYAAQFHAINAEWIEDMFSIEPHDEEVLKNPHRSIIDRGGEIMFVADGHEQILGTCALERQPRGYVELSKMGVTPKARGRGAGRFLLNAVLQRAETGGFAAKLFLVSNIRCAAAVRLYEAAGFQHDPEIMKIFGQRYARTDVAMRYAPVR